MKSFIYIGDPNTDDEAQKGRKEITFRGVTFKAGKASAVEDEATIKKLLGNSHFELVEEADGQDSGDAEQENKEPAPVKEKPAPKPKPKAKADGQDSGDTPNT